MRLIATVFTILNREAVGFDALTLVKVTVSPARGSTNYRECTAGMTLGLLEDVSSLHRAFRSRRVYFDDFLEYAVPTPIWIVSLLPDFVGIRHSYGA